MIKQDNRSQQNSFNEKIDVLTNLLSDDNSSKQKHTVDVSPVSQETEKIIIISVNGNNNVIATEKSRCITWLHGRKISLVAGAVLSLLFF